MKSKWVLTVVLMMILLAVLLSLGSGEGRAQETTPLPSDALNPIDLQISTFQCPGAPFIVPSGNYISANYHYCRGTQCEHPELGYHQGIDIKRYENGIPLTTPGVVPVYAAYAGIVDSIVGVSGLFIRHTNVGGEPVVFTYYTHMANAAGTVSYIEVEAGEWVEQGDLIGYQGNYRSSSVHLHFSVSYPYASDYNYNQDPSPFLGFNVNGDDGALPGYITSDRCASSNQPPNPPSLDSPPSGAWLGSRAVTLSWHDGGDPDNDPYRDYYIEVWKPGWKKKHGWATSTSWQVTVPSDGTYSWHVKAGDGELSSDWSQTRTFKVDASFPNAPTISVSGPGCGGIQNNEWQNTCYDPAFSYSASDSGSGVKDYHRYWGTLSSGSPDTWTTGTTFDPDAITSVDGYAKYYLNLTARDNMNHESGRSSFGVLYDGTVPTITFSINNNASTTNQTNVHINISAEDTGSGVSQVCISNNDTCTNWQPYANTILWTLPTLDRHTLPVYVQVRDHAGNESTVASDSIYLNLYPPMPHSANYRICADVVDAGGSAGITSTSYSLVSAIGQPWATGDTANTSGTYNEHSGFLSSITACLPISYTITSNYTITQWVIASSGGLRGSPSYRLGDTTGQPAASGANAFTGTSYILSSGFWSQVTGTVPPTTTVPPTPVPITPTPTPGPTPTPQPSGFGVSINDGDLFTDDPFVTVRVSAPNVTHMRLNNDGGYTDNDWRTYQITSTWVLSTYSDYVMPRYIYAWFRDAGSNVYGSYFDDIIYDPVAPEGSVTIVTNVVITASLWLEAWDDNSGVDQMRVSEDPDGQGTAWQSYTNTITWVLQSDVVYAQFRDRAGNESLIYGSDGSVYNPNADYQYIYLPLILRTN